jgi:hypothetical protein
MSFIECTAMSMPPSRSASSISRVNRPLPPISLSGRSKDLVARGFDHHHLEGRLWQAMRRHQAAPHLIAPATAPAGEPRVPIFSGEVGSGICSVSMPSPRHERRRNGVPGQLPGAGSLTSGRRLSLGTRSAS